MSRWSEAYKARALGDDTVDTMQSSPATAAQTVNSVNSVAVWEKGNEGASDAALEATERAAVIAESEHGGAAAPVQHRLPASWANASLTPTAGARCSGCRQDATWWCEMTKPTGWRCATCYPPAHLRVGQFRDVKT